jgi:DNA polymerase III subunit alpha
MNSTDKLAVVLNEAKSMGVEVLPPDINEGQTLFAPTADGKAIRFGLAAIKGVGEIAVQGIIQARNEGGSFTSLEDLCGRVDTRTVNRKVLEALIKSGACDCLGETRASLFARIDRALARGASLAQDRQTGQSSLFGMLEESAPAKPDPQMKLPEWPEHERLAHEKELLGVYVTGHPLLPYLPLLEKYALHNSATAKQVPARTLTRIGGLIGAVQQGVSKKNGKPYAMVTLEDLEGSMSMLCFNENYDRYRDLLVPGQVILVVGEINNDEDKPKIFPQEIIRLEDAPLKYTRQVHLRFRTDQLNPERLETVRTMAESSPGKCPLFLCIRQPGGEWVFIETHEKYRVTPSREFQRVVDETFGADTFYAKVDTAVPERPKKPWERRNGNGEE